MHIKTDTYKHSLHLITNNNVI